MIGLMEPLENGQIMASNRSKGMVFFFKRLILVWSVLILVSCAVKMDNPAAPSKDRGKVESFHVEDGLARVHFFMGKAWIGATNTMNMDEAGEIYVNDTLIGTIGDDKEYIAVDLYPGEYTFGWKSLSPGQSMIVRENLQIALTGRQLVFLQANRHDLTPSAAFLLGPFGGFAIKYNERLDVDQDFMTREKLSDYELILLDKSSKNRLRQSLNPDTISKENKIVPKDNVKEEHNVKDRLTEVEELYSSGLITEEEYQQKRKEILESI